MGSLVVIHGTGVRGPAYDALFHLVEQKLHALRPEIVPVRCLWGDEFGARLPERPLCLPRGGSDRSASGLTPEELSLQLWAQLYDEPLTELRILGTRRDSGDWEAAELLDVFRTAQPTATLMDGLEQLSLQIMWTGVRAEITASRECKGAIERAPASTFELRKALSRAIMASITARVLLTGAPVPDDTLRDTMVAEMVDMFLPPGEVETEANDRSLGEVRSALRESVWYGVQWLSAGFLERKRLAEAAIMTPIPGDIILYQSPQGDSIRDFIAQTIREAPKPCCILAHSLGSVAAVDVLIQKGDLNVAQLITIGSPAALFHEMNALVSLPRQDVLPRPNVLPAHFPQWLNIYDPRDLISYLAKSVFYDDSRVADQSHESGQPLIAAHSAYWASDTVWSMIGKVIPKA